MATLTFFLKERHWKLKSTQRKESVTRSSFANDRDERFLLHLNAMDISL